MDFCNQCAPLPIANYQLSKYLQKCQPSLYSFQLSHTHKQHGDTSVTHQAFKSGSLRLLNRHSTYLVPAYGSVPGPEGSLPAAHMCWRQYHSQVVPEYQGLLCLWRSVQARHSLDSRSGRMQKENIFIRNTCTNIRHP